MNRCVVPGCEGHLGRHSNCLSEALWNLGEDYANESGGDSEGPGYAMLFMFHDSVWISDLDKGLFLTLGVPDFLIGGGTFVMLTRANSAMVFMEGFTCEDDARAAFDAHDKAYGLWYDATYGDSEDISHGG